MYQSAQEFIDDITTRKSLPTKREDFAAMMDELGHPEQALKCLHVAGTNGKGSVTNYLRSILQENGYKVGSFTSPHLVVHNDRIRINDENIPDEKLLELANRFEEVFNRYHMGMFQIDMLLSIYYFLEEKVDYVVYEVGMGGRLDSTNIISPLASVITNIGYDHMKVLGDTLDKIAYEKAGIIKEKTPAFTMEHKPECVEVFARKAEEKGSELHVSAVPSARLEGQKVVFSYREREVALDTIALYQAENAALALDTALYLKENHLIELDEEKIYSAVEHAFWKGRFEVLRKDPLIIVDGAHNEHGVKGILDSIRALRKPVCIVASILRDKEYEKMLKDLKEVSDELVITSFDYYRATSAEQLSANVEATVIDDFRKAIQYAMEKYEEGSILVTGSLYFVSEVRHYFEEQL